MAEPTPLPPPIGFQTPTISKWWKICLAVLTAIIFSLLCAILTTVCKPSVGPDETILLIFEIIATTAWLIVFIIYLTKRSRQRKNASRDVSEIQSDIEIQTEIRTSERECERENQTWPVSPPYQVLCSRASLVPDRFHMEVPTVERGRQPGPTRAQSGENVVEVMTMPVYQSKDGLESFCGKCGILLERDICWKCGTQIIDV